MNAQTGRPASESESERGGVMVGQVIGNCDEIGLGRVQVRLAWRGGIEIWARVATQDNGTYFIPQVGDEVLIAFHQGDGNEAYVLGRVWNDANRPPRQGLQDPVTQRVLRTPWGHEIAFNQTEMSVVITTDSGQHVTLKPDGVEIAADDSGTAVVRLDTAGNVSIRAATKISFSAPEIELQAQAKLTLNGGANAELRAGLVQIN